MELKVVMMSKPLSLKMRFNRTFMELKVCYFGSPSARCGCFNRTFMELKDSVSPEDMNEWAFQSHLYGIERYAVSRCNGFNVVSIAPLWN